jgi:hypothetical protein
MQKSQNVQRRPVVRMSRREIVRTATPGERWRAVSIQRQQPARLLNNVVAKKNMVTAAAQQWQRRHRGEKRKLVRTEGES